MPEYHDKEVTISLTWFTNLLARFSQVQTLERMIEKNNYISTDDLIVLFDLEK